jgi:hypothetical protein
MQTLFFLLGITFLTNTRVISVTTEMTSNHSLYSAPWPLYFITVINTITGIEQTLTCEALFNATGRVPNVANLELDKVLSPFQSPSRSPPF